MMQPHYRIDNGFRMGKGMTQAPMLQPTLPAEQGQERKDGQGHDTSTDSNALPAEQRQERHDGRRHDTGTDGNALPAS